GRLLLLGAVDVVDHDPGPDGQLRPQDGHRWVSCAGPAGSRRAVDEEQPDAVEFAHGGRVVPLERLLPELELGQWRGPYVGVRREPVLVEQLTGLFGEALVVLQ